LPRLFERDMEKVIMLPELAHTLNELIHTLYEEEYFGFIISAQEYIDNIINFIYTIPTQRQRTTKNKIYGEFYCTYKHNNKTSWYIFFDKEEDIFLATFITNNHFPLYPMLIA
jgi:hypothetical protein